jgi:cytochrome oxidase Cu insertion factor (SCO1/SenC/PrrC family)
MSWQQKAGIAVGVSFLAGYTGYWANYAVKRRRESAARRATDDGEAGGIGQDAPVSPAALAAQVERVRRLPAIVEHTGTPKPFANVWTDRQKRIPLVYFGYARCPDICPAELKRLALVLAALPVKVASQIQPIFVTLDPARDSAGGLRDYLSEFSPDLVGVTGTPATINGLRRAYNVYSAKAMFDDDDYLLDHSIMFLVLNERGEYQKFYDSHATSEEIVQDLTERVSRLTTAPSKGEDA